MNDYTIANTDSGKKSGWNPIDIAMSIESLPLFSLAAVRSPAQHRFDGFLMLLEEQRVLRPIRSPLGLDQLLEPSNMDGDALDHELAAILP